MRRLALCTALALLSFPTFTLASPPDGHVEEVVHVQAWTAAPFVVMLLCIALLPLLAGHFWHKNLNKLIVSIVLSIPVVIYLVSIQGDPHSDPHSHSLGILKHGLIEYFAFIVLLGSLYAISGGIVVEGDLKGRPRTNGVLLLTGAVLANFIGTTGASMLLIRPYLRMNSARQHKSHLPIFFIFMVSNVGGLLTPLGDPPLFLGFIKGVSFFWTLRLWLHWIVVNGGVLCIFLLWDSWAYSRESLEVKQRTPDPNQSLRLKGLINFLFLGGVIGAVLLKSPLKEKGLDEFFISEAIMIGMSLLSLWFTSKELRHSNAFTWFPIIEVAVLFIGIFVTMVPALELLKEYGESFALTQPWQYFWVTGSLSAFLDNAPTYVTFGALAAKSSDFSALMSPDKAPLLAAISCGAVFMGAMTYIGNGPNFMVKAITEENNVHMPSFFGYLAYSCLILLPLFVVVTFVFFSPL